MANESSAIVRFIELQRQQPIATVSLPQPEPLTDPFSPVRTRPVPLLVIGALLLFGGMAAGGIYLARDVLFGPGGSSSAAGAAADLDRDDNNDAERPIAGDPADKAERAMAQDPAKEADRAVALDPLPQTAGVVAPLSADPEPETQTPAQAALTSAETGFDLRVTPTGSKVFLDGKELGVAPLRARDVVAGAHTIDVEGPDGYFSKRLEINLVLDQPQTLRVELAALEPTAQPIAAPETDIKAPTAAVATDDVTKSVKSMSKRDERRQARREARAEARRAKRAARAEARAARKAEKAEKAEKAPEKASPSDDAEQAAALAELKAGQTGQLRLGAKPPCDIYIDGKATGTKTPQRSIKLGAGSHQVKLVNEEHGISSKFRVKIAPGKTTTVIRDLSDQIK